MSLNHFQMSTDSDYPAFAEEARARVEQALDHWLPGAQTCPDTLHRAMRYAVLGGGKRMRPLLLYATGTGFGANWRQLDGPACAVELIHGYSLIHDDLPVMDNDALRRGRPSCHIAFDEATALLAGDALQTLAFYILSHDPRLDSEHEKRLSMIETLALASGSRGMAGGQAIDLESTGKELTLTELENMHIHKTGALIRASVTLGAQACETIDSATLDKLDHFSKCIGLAFQIRDDILDVEGDAATLGKTGGKDHRQEKSTYPAMMGLAAAKRLARELYEDAISHLDGLDKETRQLRTLSRYVIERTT